MRTTAIIFSMILSAAMAAAPALHASGHTDAGEAGDTGLLLSQYLEDGTDDAKKSGKETIQDLRRREMSQWTPRFIMGIGGGLDVREGFASIAVGVPLGVKYGRFNIYSEPSFIFANGQTMKNKRQGMVDSIFRAKMSGKIYQFDLPFKFNYTILDLDRNPYTPYVSAGAGYSLRAFTLSGTTLVSRLNREFKIHSMTLNAGFGFLVRTSSDTRFNVGINAVSYFNTRTGVFDYDTIGATLQFGMIVIFE
jgi:hypothetical protein